MGIVLAIILLAVLFGILGLVVAALKWALIIAVVLFLAGAVLGWTRRAT